MFNEIVTSIKAQLYERATSPLLGSFLLSWSIWNYKFLMLAFSSVEILEKYRITSEILYPSPNQAILMNIVFPTTTALAYIFIYPYPAKFVYQFSRNRQKEISNIKKTIEAETLLTAEEARAIRRELYVLEAELEKELNRKNQEIENLKLELASYRESDINSSNDSGDDVQAPMTIADLSDEEVEALKTMTKFVSKAGESDLLELLKVSSVKGKYLIGELVSKEYLHRNYDQGMGEWTYELTHDGRKFLVQRGYA